MRWCHGISAHDHNKSIFSNSALRYCLYLFANFCVTASNILSKEIPPNNTKHRNQICLTLCGDVMGSHVHNKSIFSNSSLRYCLYLIANFCVTASNILSKEIPPNNTKHRNQISKFHLILLNRFKTILQNGCA